MLCEPSRQRDSYDRLSGLDPAGTLRRAGRLLVGRAPGVQDEEPRARVERVDPRAELGDLVERAATEVALRPRREHDAHESLLLSGHASTHARRGDPLADGAQRRADLVHGSHALVSVLLEHRTDQRVDGGGHARDESARWSGLVGEHLRQHGDGGRASERGRAGERLVENAAEREDVGPGVYSLRRRDLLGRHVAGSPYEVTVGGQPSRGRHVCDPEVDQTRLPLVFPHQEHVARLHVSVHDAHAVGLGERVGESLGEKEGARELEGTVLETLLEVLALQPLHGEPRRRSVETVGDVAHDCWVADRRQHLCLAQEALEELVRRELQHLHGDELASRRVERPVNGAHAAAAHQLLEDEPAPERARRAHGTLGDAACRLPCVTLRVIPPAAS
jgi:hypothetical protein